MCRATGAGRSRSYYAASILRDSLHLGHLVPLLCLKRFQQAGAQNLCAGRRRDRSDWRPEPKPPSVKLNTERPFRSGWRKIRKQVAHSQTLVRRNSAIAANNYDWFGSIDVLTFLPRDNIGKHFSVNQMINKEAVKQRLNRRRSGVSLSRVLAYSRKHTTGVRLRLSE
ncbi:hypothetical protein KCP71_19925 [Salmonella enterica subsp. enterica]|nr:hypothetical protein KCP71_19925 [Salmonella enterica subsp. enterica]